MTKLASRTRRLGKRFYRRGSPELARALLGQVLVHGPRRGRIVETEAYLGPEDLASHARFLSRTRNQIMFGPGGLAYVYMIYGVYDMFNVVAGRAGEGGAVLVRALEPLAGLTGGAHSCRGPGKLTRAMAIDRELNGVDLTAHPELYIEPGSPPKQVAIGPRIGVAYAGEWAGAELRFWDPHSSAVSRGR